MSRYNDYQEKALWDYPELSELFLSATDDDEDIELYDDELNEYYDEIEAEDDSEAYLPEYEPDINDDSAELAEVLRGVVNENYQYASPEQMEDALFDMLEQMTPAEGFNIMGALQQMGQVGSKAIKDPMFRKIAGTALPVAGGALGTMIGGPVGIALGSKLGQVAGQAISGGEKPSVSTAQPTAQVSPQAGPAQAIPGGEKPSASTTPPTAQASPQGGSPAAAQLLQLTQNPDMLKSLLALALGSHGTNFIPVGKDGPPVSVGAFINMLGQLAGKAAADADQLYGESDEKYGYLLDSQGEFAVDPAVPEDRAQALYKALLASENKRFIGEELARQPWPTYLPFEKDTKFLVEYETVLRDFDIGKGNILERTSDLLKAKIHIDKLDIFGFHIPETYAMLMIEYVQDGPGNKAVVVVNGKQYTDNNVNIRSEQNTREILMSINFLGQKIDRISINRISANKAKIKFIAEGDQHVLILTKEGN